VQCLRQLGPIPRNIDTRTLWTRTELHAVRSDLSAWRAPRFGIRTTFAARQFTEVLAGVPRAAMLRPSDVADAILFVATRPPSVQVDWLRLGPV